MGTCFSNVGPNRSDGIAAGILAGSHVNPFLGDNPDTDSSGMKVGFPDWSSSDNSL